MPLRFRPPPLALSPETRWMLLRAFGPVGAPAAAPVEAPAALALARRFEVSARIAARQGKERLAAELGLEAAAGFARDRVATAAVSMRLMAAASQVASIAATAEPLAIPLTFLKLAGLEGAGLLAPGSRGACDVDVLAPAGRAAELWRALAAAGWQGEGPSYEHQLPALSHPERGVVEVHRLVPGLRLGGGLSATWEDLERQGLLIPLADLPGRCSAAVPEVQAAHALVHGLGQHGYSPFAYSLLKMLADLRDLGDGALTPRALAWVERDVPVPEATAVRRLGARLAAGEDPAAWAVELPEATLLRHILAGRLDADYASALRLGLFGPQPSDRGPVDRLARAVWHAVALSDAQIDAIYPPGGPPAGRPRTRLGYLGRRLARPFDLLLRLGSYGSRWLKVRGYTPP